MIYHDAVTLDLEPSMEKKLPLSDTAAAAAGCEYYVIDARWYTEIDQNWWGTVGDWQPSKTRWPESLPGILAHIRKCGMLPGLWLEPEVAGVNSLPARKPDHWFFVRHGKRVVDHGSYWLDFRNPEVPAYLSGQDLHGHNLAFLAWLESVLDRYPKLIIENCASGGGRIDYATLSRLQLESASDRKDYRRYPATVTGLSSGLLPEQLGVWSFPFAAGTADKASFNMVNAMLCLIHQSGDVAKCNPAALAQIKTAIQMYKNVLRHQIPDSILFHPQGLPSMTNTVSPRTRDEIASPTDLGIELYGQKGELEITSPRIKMACILASINNQTAYAKT